VQDFSNQGRLRRGVSLVSRPRISEVRGMKTHCPSNAWYFELLHSADISTTALAVPQAVCTQQLAKEQATGTFQHKGFPSCHGIKVRPSGYLQSDVDNPQDSLIAGRPAWAITLMSAWCWDDVLWARLQTKLCSPQASAYASTMALMWDA